MNTEEDVRLLVKRIWQRAYMDTEEQHVQLIQEYVNQELKQRDETIRLKDVEIKDLMSGQDQQAVDLVRFMNQIADQKQMEIKLYDELLKEQHKVKQLRRALRNVLKVAKSPTLTTHGMNHLEIASKLLTE